MTDLPDPLRMAIVRDPAIVSPDIKAIEAIVRMSGRQADSDFTGPGHPHATPSSSCVVVVEEGQFVGLFTEQDVVRLVAQQVSLEQVPLRQVLVPSPVTIRESTIPELVDVIELFQQHSVSHLPILDEQDRLRGLISHASLQQALRSLALQQTTSREQLQAELLARQQTEAQLHESERRYTSLVAASPVGILRTNLEGICTHANERYCEMIGVEPSALIGQPWHQGYNPDDLARINQEFEQSLQDHRPMCIEYRVQRSDGSELWVYGQAVLEYDATGQLMGYVGTITDISDRKRTELLLESQYQILEKIATAEPLSDIFQALLRAMEACLPETVCSIMLCQDGQLCHATAPSLPQESIDSFVLPIAEGAGTCGTAAYRRELVIVTDVNSDPLCRDFKPLAAILGLQSGWAIPIFGTDQEVLGVLGVHYQYPKVPQNQEIECVRKLAYLAGVAIEQQQATQALTQLNQELEARVAERTASLQASEERWQLALQGANDGIWDWNPQTHELFLSQRLKEIRGFGEDELPSSLEDCLMLIHPDDRGQVCQAIEEHLAGTTEFFEIEYRVRHKNGSYIWILSRAQAQRDESGQAVRMIGSETDISQRKRIEAELAASEAKFRRLVEGGQDLIWTIDTQDRFTYLSPQFKTLFGWEASEWIGRTSIEAVYPEDRDWLLEQRTLETINSGVSYLDFRHCHRDCPYVWVRASSTPIVNDAGVVVGYQGILSEITNLKETELALKESESRYASLAAAAPVAIFRFDQPLNCVYVNERWSEMTGRPVESAMGRGWIEALHPDDRERAVAAWANIYTNVASKDLIMRGSEGRHLRPDGTVNWFYVQVAPEFDANGNVVSYVGTLTDISDRKAVERQLQLTQYSVDHAAEGIMWFNPVNFKFCYANQAACRMLGYSLDELLQLGIPDIDPDWTNASCHAVWDASSQSGSSEFVLESRHQAKDGRIYPVEIVGNYITFDGQTFKFVRVRDISERKQLEADRQRIETELAESEAKFRRLVERGHDLIWALDQDSRFTYLSPQFQTLFGWEPEEWLGYTILTLIHPDDLWSLFGIDDPNDDSQLIATYQSHLQWGHHYEQLEVRHRCHDGNYRWVSMSCTLIVNDAGENLGTQGITRDITDRKQAEMALEQEVLRRTAIFNTSSDGIHILDKQGNLIEANERFAQMLGYTPDEVVHLHVADWDAQWSREELLEILEDDFWNQNRPFETLHRRKDGFIFPVEVSRCTMEWHGQSALVCISRDISERKQAEAQLQRTNEELAHATRLKDEFLANMSHELRTPLNSILGMSEALQVEVFGSLNEKQLRSLKLIENSGSHLLKLINDILDVSKIESGQIQLDLNPTNIIELCNSSITFIKQQALKKEIKLEVKLSPQLPRFFLVDGRRILQVLINLLNNAIKFTPAGGSVTLEATYHQHDHEISYLKNQSKDSIQPGKTDPALSQSSTSKSVKIKISDTGIGIAPEDIKRLFRPFVQVDSALNRQYAGTGLGLALVKRITELHGGVVSLESEVGVGSCFSIELPFYAAFLDTPEPTTSSESITPSNPSLPSESKVSPLILLAEDNESNISMLISYLEVSGYRLIIANNGLEAIALTKTEHPDLILMDIQMPKMDGLEAIERIRQDPQIQNIPIIALTALAMKGDREKCIAAGANEYLSKPIKLKQLIEVIQQWCHRQV